MTGEAMIALARTCRTAHALKAAVMRAEGWTHHDWARHWHAIAPMFARACEELQR